MAPEMPATRVRATMQMAIAQRNTTAGLVVRSNRKIQCAGAQHQALLQRHGLVRSKRRKGNCWGNDVLERF